MSIKFKNREHEKFYEQCLARTGGLDPYHKALHERSKRYEQNENNVISGK